MTTHNKTLVFASQNQHKFNEVLSFINQAKLPITLKPLSDFTHQSADEVGLSFVENALIKARFASAQSKLPALADDSGLCVDALEGRPGLYSARFSAQDGNDSVSDDENNQYLLKLMEPFREKSQRKAFMFCTLVVVAHPRDFAPLIAEGRWRGSISLKPAGSSGFGYDPLFTPEGSTLTAGQISLDEKNQQSHRFLALKELMAKLTDFG